MVRGLQVFGCDGGSTPGNFSPPYENGDDDNQEEQTTEHHPDN